MAKCKEEIKDGKLVITQEGKGKKFLEEVEQVTFSGSYAAKSGQEILYVTERCVFKLIDGVMTLTEIAPGIEIERDILPHMDFTPAVSPELKLMNPDIFQENWGGLKDFM